MGGGGKSKSTEVSAEFPPELIEISDRLASLSEQAFELSRPGLELGRDILQTAGGRGEGGKGPESFFETSTGGPGVLTPFIQQAVQNTNAATGRALRQTETDLARQGITGTAAANILAQQQVQGDIAASQVAPNLTTSFILPLLSGAASQSIGQIAPGLSGLGGAGSLLTPGITQNSTTLGGGLGPILSAPLAAFGGGFGSKFGAGLASKL
jgi:hypothetical protein